STTPEHASPKCWPFSGRTSTHRHRPGQRPKTAGSAFAQTNCYRFEAVLRRTVGRTDYAHLHEPLWPSTESLWCRNASPLGNENGRERMPFPERKEGFAAHVQALCRSPDYAD